MYVGLDYLGPLMVKDNDGLTKNWVCLYTCLNVRAIHLEVVEIKIVEPEQEVFDLVHALAIGMTVHISK